MYERLMLETGWDVNVNGIFLSQAEIVASLVSDHLVHEQMHSCFCAVMQKEKSSSMNRLTTSSVDSFESFKLKYNLVPLYGTILKCVANEHFRAKIGPNLYSGCPAEPKYSSNQRKYLISMSWGVTMR